MRTFQGIDNLQRDSEGSFRNFVAHCVKCEIVDHARREKAAKRGGGRVLRIGDMRSDSLLHSVFAGKSPTPSEVVSARELEERIQQALLEISDDYREIIVLRNLCEMSFGEIADAMGFEFEASARKAHSRATRKLKEKLACEGP